MTPITQGFGTGYLITQGYGVADDVGPPGDGGGVFRPDPRHGARVVHPPSGTASRVWHPNIRGRIWRADG
jgi:hypothetical protein